MADRPDRLSLEDLTARLGYDQRTIADLIASGKGPGIKIGRRYLILESWVDRWLAGELGFWSVAIAGLTVPEPQPMAGPDPIKLQALKRLVDDIA
jgi:excisionase family DNA binding protein